MKTMARGDFIEAENRINPDEATRSRQQRHFLFKKSYFHLLRKQWKKYCTTPPIIVGKGFEARTGVETEGLADPTRFILIHTHSKGNLAWNSHMMWDYRWNHSWNQSARSQDRVKLWADWILTLITDWWVIANYDRMTLTRGLRSAVDRSW